MFQHTTCLVGGFLVVWATAASATEPAPRDAQPTPPAATKQPAAAPPATPAAGTYIHVKNGTNRPLNFSLYVDCAGEGMGKFDREFFLEPGEVGIWRLGHNHRVAMTQSNGAKLYRLGLVGTDAKGLKHHWGTLGGAGMVGNEQHKTMTTSAQPVSYRHILVRPAGDF